MNTKKLFEAAAKAGIAPFEMRKTTESKLQVATFNDVVENYTVADNGSVKVRGLVDGKCGTFSSDCSEDSVIDVAIAAVKESAEFGQPVDPAFFIKASDYKYEKVNTYNAALAAVPASKYIDIAKTVARKALSSDKRMESVQVQVEYSCGETEFCNSNGLALEDKANYCMIFASAKAVDGENVESGEHYEILTTLDGFDVDDFAAKLVDDTVGQLGGEVIKSGKYKVVYSQDCVASLLSAVRDGFSAFNVEQHVSLLEGKVGQPVFSKLLTVEETPIGSDPFCSAFDDEGVARTNKALIDKGVVTGYVYDLATAARAGVKSTGNGRLEGGNVRPAVSYMTVKAGDGDLDKLFELVGDGIYITGLGGVVTGLNPQSGDYSLQACGFVIEKGKKAKPVSLITVAGNIMTDFADLGAVGNDMKLTYMGIKCPSVVVNSIAVSGK